MDVVQCAHNVSRETNLCVEASDESLSLSLSLFKAVRSNQPATCATLQTRGARHVSRANRFCERIVRAQRHALKCLKGASRCGVFL